MKKIENMRKTFLKMRGGKLISIEAYVLAFVVLVIILVNGQPPYVAFGVAFLVGFIFPIFISVFKSIAWIASVGFSILWGIFSGLLISEFLGDFIGFIFSIIFTIISFSVHRNYSALRINSISLKRGEGFRVSDNIYHNKEEVKFCPKCGRRINPDSGICDVCNK